MVSTNHFAPKIGTSLALDEERAAEELVAQLGLDEPFSTLFFCSSKYDLSRLGRALRTAFDGPLHGCTSAGQIGPMGFQRGGITAISLPSAAVEITSWPIRGLAHVSTRASEIGSEIRRRRAARSDTRAAFGLLLIDGLSLAEERVASALRAALREVPMIGGSAGDDLAFQSTGVFVDGEFSSDTATLLLFETHKPFRLVKLQHVAPTGKVLVVTRADPDTRRVIEINGKPAAAEYARLVGRRVEELDAQVFAEHPLLLHIESDYYVRSVYRKNAEGTLTLFCAIEEGLVLHLGRAGDLIESIDGALSGGKPELVIGCDCILRRLELERRGIDGDVGSIFARNRVFGFSTYGEQYNAIHVNQTFTGVCLGGDE